MRFECFSQRLTSLSRVLALYRMLAALWKFIPWQNFRPSYNCHENTIMGSTPCCQIACSRILLRTVCVARSSVTGHFHLSGNDVMLSWISWARISGRAAYFDERARGSVSGWGAMLQGGRSRVRIPVRSLHFVFNLPNPSGRTRL
jgi:hypothetical protein